MADTNSPATALVDALDELQTLQKGLANCLRRVQGSAWLLQADVVERIVHVTRDTNFLTANPSATSPLEEAVAREGENLRGLTMRFRETATASLCGVDGGEIEQYIATLGGIHSAGVDLHETSTVIARRALSLRSMHARCSSSEGAAAQSGTAVEHSSDRTERPIAKYRCVSVAALTTHLEADDQAMQARLDCCTAPPHPHRCSIVGLAVLYAHLCCRIHLWLYRLCVTAYRVHMHPDPA
jgi:hypothetical protein